MVSTNPWFAPATVCILGNIAGFKAFSVGLRLVCGDGGIHNVKRLPRRKKTANFRGFLGAAYFLYSTGSGRRVLGDGAGRKVL